MKALEKMTGTQLTFCIKMLCVAVFSVWMYGAFAILSVLKFAQSELVEIHTDSQGALILTLIAMLFSLYGYFIAFLSDKIIRKTNKNVVGLVIQKFIVGIFLAVAIAPIVWYCWRTPTNMMLVVGFVLLVIAFILGYKNYSRGYDQILTSTWAICNTIFLLVTVFLLFLMHKEIPLLLFSIFLLVGYIVYFLMKSQANIDFLMMRRKHNMDNLPKSIRRYTLLLTMGFIAIIFIALLLRDAVLIGIDWLFLLLRQVILLFIFIAGLFSREEESVMEEAPVGEGGQLLLEGEAGSDVFNAISVIFAVGVTAFLLINFRKQILTGIKKGIITVLSYIYRFFSSTPIGSNKVIAETEYYYDDVKTVDPIKMSEKRVENITARNWRKNYKGFVKMSNSDAKYRYGYQLTLQWLQIKGAKLSEADTSLEVLAKCKAMLPKESFVPMTDGYNKVRYDESTENNPYFTQTQLEQLVADLSKSL